jgi:hypothetical protein
MLLLLVGLNCTCEVCTAVSKQICEMDVMDMKQC